MARDSHRLETTSQKYKLSRSMEVIVDLHDAQRVGREYQQMGFNAGVV